MIEVNDLIANNYPFVMAKQQPAQNQYYGQGVSVKLFSGIIMAIIHSNSKTNRKVIGAISQSSNLRFHLSLTLIQQVCDNSCRTHCKRTKICRNSKEKIGINKGALCSPSPSPSATWSFKDSSGWRKLRSFQGNSKYDKLYQPQWRDRNGEIRKLSCSCWRFFIEVVRVEQ